MEILNKLYKIKTLANNLDGVGGVGWNTYWYNYLFFDLQIYYMFSSIEQVTRSVKYPIQEFDDSKTIKNYKALLIKARKGGYKILSDIKIQFELPVQSINEKGNFIETNRIYTATFQKDGKFLRLKAFDENNPTICIVDEEYEEVKI